MTPPTSWTQSPSPVPSLLPSRIQLPVVDADELLAKEMLALSVNERNQALNEIHGVEDLTQEDDRITTLALKLLDLAVSQILKQEETNILDDDVNNPKENNSKTYAYRIALKQNQSYVERRFLRVAFLRAEIGNGWEQDLKRKKQVDQSKSANNIDIPASIYKVADRIMNYFQLKLHLWGLTLLTRDITLDDLDASDRQCLDNGYITLLPERDRAGRAIICSLASLVANCTTAININRSFYYVFQCALEDEETQKKGVVCVGYNIDRQQSSFDKDIAKLEAESFEGNNRIFQYLYFRMTAIHIVYDEPKLRPIMGVAVYLIGQRIRARLRAHFCTGHMEGQYTLLTFGIPTYCLPIDANGVIQLNYHIQWLQKRQIQENQQLLTFLEPMLLDPVDTLPLSNNGDEPTPLDIMDDSLLGGPATDAGYKKATKDERQSPQQLPGCVDTSSGTTSLSSSSDDNAPVQKVIQVPGPSDVIVGRGKLANRHAGNRQYNNLINQYFDQYNGSTRFEKTVITGIIVKTIQDTWDGKFLRLCDKGWIEIDDTESRAKVAHTFRNFRRKPTRKKSKNNTAASAGDNGKIVKKSSATTSSGSSTKKTKLSNRGEGTMTPATISTAPVDPLTGSFFASCLSDSNSNDGCTPSSCLPSMCLTGHDIGAVGGAWMDGTKQPRLM